MAKKRSRGTYFVVLRCRNCGVREVWEVVKGEAVVDAVELADCPGCECLRGNMGWEVMSECVV